MNMRMFLIAAFMGIALAGAPAGAAGIGAVLHPAAEMTPSALTPARRAVRSVGRVVRRAAPALGRVARTAGKL